MAQFRDKLGSVQISDFKDQIGDKDMKNFSWFTNTCLNSDLILILNFTMKTTLLVDIPRIPMLSGTSEIYPAISSHYFLFES